MMHDPRYPFYVAYYEMDLLVKMLDKVMKGPDAMKPANYDQERVEQLMRRMRQWLGQDMNGKAYRDDG